jgi:hypothetical protein
MRALKSAKLSPHFVLYKNATYITMNAENCDHLDISETTHVVYSCSEVQFTVHPKYGIGNSHYFNINSLTTCKVNPSAKHTYRLMLFMC